MDDGRGLFVGDALFFDDDLFDGGVGGNLEHEVEEEVLDDHA